MSVASLLESMATAIETGVSGLKTVQTHGGRVTLDELRRVAVRAPAVLVTCLGGNVTNQGGQKVGDWDWVAFVVAKDAPQSPRTTQALLLAESLAAYVADARWGSDAVGAPDRVNARNLYSGKLDAHAVALWAVTWRQSIDLDVFDQSSLDDFVTFAHEMDVHPADEQVEIEGRVTLEQD